MSQTLRPHTSDRAHGRMHYPWVVVAPRWICKMRYLINTYHIVVCYVLCWFSIFRLLVWVLSCFGNAAKGQEFTPASCNYRCGSDLCFASVASVVKELYFAIHTP